MVALINAKVEELDASIAAMKANLELSENTVRTQTYQRTHEIRNLLLMRTFIEGKELSGDLIKWFESATTLTATRKAKNTVEFHDGDNMLEIISSHENMNYKKLVAMMEEQGFHLDGHIVRK
jgi:hypothetical protein